MLMTIEVAIRTIEPMRTISGLILIPWVSSLKKVRSPALDAGIGALFFLLLMTISVDPSLFLSVAPPAKRVPEPARSGGAGACR